VSVMAPSGLRVNAMDRPGRPEARTGTLKRTRDLAMWAAWQGGVSVAAIAREFKVNRVTVWRRIQLVKTSGVARGATRRVD
jgi:DNA invertase Pin-like site-specific DNA recombinase